MSRSTMWIIFVLAFTVILGGSILAVAEEHIINGNTDVSLIFEVYGASSGDPCLVEADITDWNLKYYIDGAAAKDVNNATLGTLGTHADNTIASLGDGLWWACFPDTCFNGGVNTKVTCWLTHDANEFICPAITVLLTPDDYNDVTGLRETDVQWGRGEALFDPEPRFDAIDNNLTDARAEIAALQSTADTIDGTADTIQAVTAALPDGGALTTLQADANTAAAATATALSSAVWTNTKAGYLDMAISDVNGAGGGDSNALAAMTIVDTNVAVADTASSFTLTDGKAAADAYNWHIITITDANDSNKETRLILTYSAERVVTVNEPFSFTPAVGDVVKIWAVGYFRRARNPLTDPIDY